jgi:transcription elongation factor SPT6
MSGNIRDLFDNQAELDDDEDDESFDDETGEPTRTKPRAGPVEDSSEEEDDDDDEEEAKRVCS